MNEDITQVSFVATCHCGAVAITLTKDPIEVAECNCSLCRRYAPLWFYCSEADLTVSPVSVSTHSYAWNGRHVDFHRCARCGCLTHWVPRDSSRNDRGVNARLLAPDVLGRARVRHRDGADTGEYLD